MSSTILGTSYRDIGAKRFNATYQDMGALQRQNQSTATLDDVSLYFGQTAVVTVTGLASSVQGSNSIAFGGVSQTISNWSVTDGTGTFTVTFSDRTGLYLDAAVDLTMNTTEIVNGAYFTPVKRTDRSQVTLVDPLQSDPLYGLATNFLTELIATYQIEYTTTVGGTITVDTAGQPSAGVGYVSGTFIDASAWPTAEDIQFKLTDSGTISGAAQAAQMFVRNFIRSMVSSFLRSI